MFPEAWKRHEEPKFIIKVSTAGGSFYQYAEYETRKQALKAAVEKADKLNREIQVCYRNNLVARIFPRHIRRKQNERSAIEIGTNRD